VTPAPSREDNPGRPTAPATGRRLFLIEAPP
jgi:hypothetical protein